MKFKKLVIFVFAAAIISPSILIAATTTPNDPVTVEMKTRKKNFKKASRQDKKQFKQKMRASKATKLEKKKMAKDFDIQQAEKRLAFHKEQRSSLEKMPKK